MSQVIYSKTHISSERLYPPYPTADLSHHNVTGNQPGNMEDVNTAHPVHFHFKAGRVKTDGCSGNARHKSSDDTAW